MFTKGQLIFVGIFVVAFIAAMVWGYRKEAKLNRIHFPKSYRILLGIIFTFIALFLIVKLRRYI